MDMNVKTSALFLTACTVLSCSALTDEGRLFKAALQLTDFTGPTNRYTWVCPCQMSVSNTTVRIGMHSHSENYFNVDLLMQDGTVVGGCVVRTAASSVEALDMICDRIRFGSSAPLQVACSGWRTERDGQGNILFTSRGRDETGNVVCDRSIFYRTYGNLYIGVSINTGRCNLCAWNFALPLIQGGLQNH